MKSQIKEKIQVFQQKKGVTPFLMACLKLWGEEIEKLQCFSLQSIKLPYCDQEPCFKRLLRPFSLKVLKKMARKFIKQVTYKGKVMKKCELCFSNVS